MTQPTTQMKAYYTALYAFLQVVRSHLVLRFPNAAASSLSYVRLSVSGAWEITETFTDNLGLMPGFGEKGIPQGICLPLVLPLVPIILVAHLETQRERIEAVEIGASGHLSGKAAP